MGILGSEMVVGIYGSGDTDKCGSLGKRRTGNFDWGRSRRSYCGPEGYYRAILICK